MMFDLSLGPDHFSGDLILIELFGCVGFFGHLSLVGST